MFYTVYKITNNVNGKFYIGIHRTKNINDKYMGSGKYIKRAIKKYGIENFSKHIIAVFDNPDDMCELEMVLVDEAFVNNPKTYNLTVGGTDPLDFVNSSGKNLYGLNGDLTHGQQNLKSGDYWKQQMLKQGTWDAHLKHLSNIIKKRYEDGFVSLFTTNNPQHTEEGRNAHKQALAKIKHQQGVTNSQYGSMWITNGTENKKIKKESLIPEGWNKGRITKSKC